MPRRRMLLAVGGGALLLLAACQLILGVDDEVGAPMPDGGGAEGGGGDVVAPPRCSPFSPEIRWLPPGDGEGDVLVLALRSIALAPRDAGGIPLGFDLDGLCTEADADLPCMGASADADGGVDNQLRIILSQLGLSSKLDDPPAAAVNDELSAGKYGALLLVRGFDFAKTDDSVVVQLAASTGMQRLCSEIPPLDAATTRPSEAGLPYSGNCEVWSLGSYNALADLVGPVPTSKDAYYRDRTLVARFPDGLPFALGPLTVMLEKAIITARLVPEGGDDIRGDGGVTASGVITGIVRAEELIGAVRRTTFSAVGGGPGAPRPLCEQGVDSVLRQFLCEGRDSKLSSGKRDERCGGLSVAFGFYATRVKPGNRGTPTTETPCEDAGLPVFDAACLPDE